MPTLEKKSIKQNPVFKIVFILIAICIVLFGCATTPLEGLTVEGWRMIWIVVAAIVLFISESLPLVCTCMMIIFAMKYTGAATMSDITKSAASTTTFFIMAGFGLGAALENTNLAAILLRGLYKLGKGDSRKMISAVCWMSAIISIFVSDAAAQIVCITVVMSIIKAIGNPTPGSSRLCGGMMMAVTVGAFTGGLFLPCSNSVNVAVMDLAEVVSGQPMTFFQWAIFGIPIGFLLTLFAAWRIPRYFKPENLDPNQIGNIEKIFDGIPQKLERKDWSYLTITVVMMFFWIASNWIKTFDVATVAIGGMFLMMCPGINLLSAKDYAKNFKGTLILVMTCIFPMASAMAKTGAGEWVIGKIFANSTGWSLFTVVIVATIAAFLVHLLIPAGSANGVLSASIIGPVGVAAGLPVASILMIVGVQAGAAFLFPIEGGWAQTFGYGYYKFDDCFKGLWPVTVCSLLLCIVVVSLLTLIYAPLGLI